MANVRYWHLADIRAAQCPLSVVKQTSEFGGAMSAFDPKSTFEGRLITSGKWYDVLLNLRCLTHEELGVVARCPALESLVEIPMSKQTKLCR